VQLSLHSLVLVVVFEGHSGCVPFELVFFLFDADLAFGQAASRYEAEHHCTCKDGGGVEHAHALCVHEVRVLDVVEAHSCLVRQEDSVVAENHCGSNAEEDNTDE